MAEQFHRQPQLRTKQAAGQHQLALKCFCIDSIARLAPGCQQHFAIGELREIGVLPHHGIACASGIAAGCGDERAEVAPAVEVVRQHHQRERRRGLHAKLGTGQQLEAHLPGHPVRAHHTGHRAFVGDGQRGVAEFVRARDQLFGPRGAALEAEIAQRMEFGIGRQCGVHGGSGKDAMQVPTACAPSRGWKIHSRPACSEKATQ